MAYALIGLAAIIHYLIFAMESLLWGTPEVNRAFKMSPELAESNRLFAFNQGFYNLFLALGATAGIVISLWGGKADVGGTLMGFSAASMVGASLVLVYSKPKAFPAAIIQGAAPLLGLVFLFLK